MINASNDEQLKYRKFMKRASLGGTLEIKALALNAILGGGKIDSFKSSEQIDAEIELLEKVTTIENYFKIAITIPQDITIEDHETLDHVYKIINEGSYSGRWSNFSAKFEFGEDLKNKIEEMNDITYIFAYSCIANVELFDQIFTFPMRRILNTAKIKDIDKLKQKAKILDSGDIFTVYLVPGESNKKGVYEDTFEEDIEITCN